MGGEDHGAALDLVQALETVVPIDQLDPVLLQLVGDVDVVDKVTEHPDLFSGMSPGSLFCRPDRLHHAVAVATRSDLDYVHDWSLPAPSRCEPNVTQASPRFTLACRSSQPIVIGPPETLRILR